MVGIDIFPLQYRIANAFLSYARYIGKFFWPQNLAILYPFDARAIRSWQVVMCALLLIAISILAIRFGQNRKYLLVGWFWFLGTLVPVIGLVQVGSQSFADRYTYIPYIGLFIMIAWGLPELLSRWHYRKIFLGLSTAIALTILGICAHRQVSFWNNNLSIFPHALEVTQNNTLAYINLGNAYNSMGRYQDAVESYKQAIKIKPDYAEGHYNLGVAYGALGRRQDEIEAYKQTLRINPDYVEAHVNLGNVYNELGSYQDAIEAYKQAIKIKPDCADAYINLGVAFYKLGRYQDAVEAYKQAIKINPTIPMAHYALGVAYSVTGDRSLALEEYKILKTLNAGKADELFKLINK